MSSLSDGLFDGPGELRRLCRDLDWASTPLGPVGSWSPVLRSTLQLCLDSGFPILINWGPELVAVYNDAFAPLIGGKHPEALGRSAKSMWPEAWDQIGTRLDEVLVRGRTLQYTNEQQVLERNGYPEECYFTFSHSPIRGADGTIVGLFMASTETTGQILSERRMRVVREVGAISVAAADTTRDSCRAILDVLQRTRETVPFAAAYLIGPKGELELVDSYGLNEPGDAKIAGPDGSGAPGWPVPGVKDVIASGRDQLEEGLRSRFPERFAAGPIGPLTPDQAVLVPLTVSGRADPIGAMVLGVNPYRPLDDGLREFHALLVRQIRVTLTDTVAYETERHRAQVLADLDRAKTEFYQNVSHELRTPLTLLLAPLQDLLTDTDAQSRPQAPAQVAASRRNVEAAVRAADRLRTMVDALLDFSGAEANQLSPDRRPVDVAGLTADTASMFRSPAEHAGLMFTVDVPAEPLTAAVDRVMWSTIVTNLLSNAVKYTQHGSITVSLTPGDDDTAVLTVTDTGPGISAEQQPRVFDRYHRAPTGAGRDQPAGAGIGLAVVADLITAHHGRIELVSTPGSGSTFTVTISLTDRTGTDITAGPDERPGAADGRATGHDQAAGDWTRTGPRVLVVEDDTDLRGYLTRLLTADGWVVNAVPDAETALAQVNDSSTAAPDVVLTDVMLPGRDGLHLLGELRAAPATARLPVIVLTARGGPDDAAQGMAAGADDYISKPFTTGELLARVRAHHELHQRRESAVGAAEDRAGQIRGALQSNRVIGTATGILMVKHRLTAAQAFALLVAGSQHTNRKVRDLAADVAATGNLSLRPTLTDELLTKATRT